MKDINNINRYKISTKISFNSRYYFANWCYAQSIRGAKQTKTYKHYKKEFNDSKIVGLTIEQF
jgi:hypothetical protein